MTRLAIGLVAATVLGETFLRLGPLGAVVVLALYEALGLLALLAIAAARTEECAQYQRALDRAAQRPAEVVDALAQYDARAEVAHQLETVRERGAWFPGD